MPSLRLRMWPSVRTKPAQLCNPKRCGLQLYTWGLMFSFAGLGVVQGSSITVLIKPYADRGESHLPLICMCVSAQSVMCFFALDCVCTDFVSDHTYTSIWSYIYIVCKQHVFILNTQKQTEVIVNIMIHIFIDALHWPKSFTDCCSHGKS